MLIDIVFHSREEDHMIKALRHPLVQIGSKQPRGGERAGPAALQGALGRALGRRRLQGAAQEVSG